MKNMNDFKHFPKEDSSKSKYYDLKSTGKSYSRDSVFRLCKKCEGMFMFTKKDRQYVPYDERHFCEKCRGLHRMQDLC